MSSEYCRGQALYSICGTGGPYTHSYCVKGNDGQLYCINAANNPTQCTSSSTSSIGVCESSNEVCYWDNKCYYKCGYETGDVESSCYQLPEQPDNDDGVIVAEFNPNQNIVNIFAFFLPFVLLVIAVLIIRKSSWKKFRDYLSSDVPPPESSSHSFNSEAALMSGKGSKHGFAPTAQLQKLAIVRPQFTKLYDDSMVAGAASSRAITSDFGPDKAKARATVNGGTAPAAASSKTKFSNPALEKLRKSMASNDQLLSPSRSALHMT